MTTLNSTYDIPGLKYMNLESYFADTDLMQLARRYDPLEELEQHLDETMDPDDAEKAKEFILHMYGVQYHLLNLLFEVETETARSEEAVIRGYLSDMPLIGDEDKKAANDAAILIRNRDLYELEQLGLTSNLVS